MARDTGKGHVFCGWPSGRTNAICCKHYVSLIKLLWFCVDAQWPAHARVYLRISSVLLICVPTLMPALPHLPHVAPGPENGRGTASNFVLHFQHGFGC